MAATPSPPSEAQIAEAVARLSPDEAAYYLGKLSASLRKRKLQLVGQLAALIGAAIGLIIAMLVYATRSPGQFTGWVFLVPLALAGGALWFFGRLADRAGAQAPSGPPPANEATS